MRPFSSWDDDCSYAFSREDFSVSSCPHPTIEGWRIGTVTLYNDIELKSEITDKLVEELRIEIDKRLIEDLLIVTSKKRY